MRLNQRIAFPRNYIVWDLETGGLDPKTCPIVEVAVVIVQDGTIADQWSALLNNNVDIDERATAVHGITREMCEKEGKEPKQVLGRLRQNIYDCEAHVTHNGTRFDLIFLEHALREMGLDIDPVVLFEKHVDTAAMYKADGMREPKGWQERWNDYFNRVLNLKVPGLKYNVGACCDDLGISREGVQQHRALADVILTNEIYKRLVD